MNRPVASAALAAVAALFVASASAASLAPGDFAWRAPVDVPAGAGLARLDLPPQALVRLQTADARDLRVFNAAGEAVPFAWIASPASAPKPPEEHTRTWRALPLYAAAAASAKPNESMQVRIEGRSGGVWVRMDGGQAPGAHKLDSALFTTQDEPRPIAAIDVQAILPANTPVRVTAFASTDLAHWTPLAMRGRIYRFEGPDAPSNLRLRFDAPVELKDRYLRLGWDGQEGVSIAAIEGVVAGPAPAPHRARVELPLARQAAPDALDVETGFATPMAALVLEPQRDNTLLPVRVLGRNDASQPWRQLGQTAVYRIGQGTDRLDSPALSLHGASARMLRIQSTNGAALSPGLLKASVEFDPSLIVLVATGPAPFVLAVGHREAAAAALPERTITSLLGSRAVDSLPLASVGAGTEVPPRPQPFGWFPGAPGKREVLWAVLLAGVSVLGGVAWSLLRQMNSRK